MNSQALQRIIKEATAELTVETKGTPVSKIYEKYINDPVGFGNTLLGNKYTSDIEELMLSVRDNEITVAESANAVGKTFAAADIAIHFYKCYKGAQVYVLCAPPEENLKKIFWAELSSRITANPGMFENDKVMSLEVIRKDDPKSFIMGVTIPTTGSEKDREAKVSGKHAPYLLFIADEADAIPVEIFKGIESCMSGGYARLLLLHNPRQKKGKPYEYSSQNKAKVVHLSAFSHPNVITGNDIIPGAVRQSVTIRRIHEWTQPATPLDLLDHPKACFDIPDFLVGKEVASTAGDALPALEAGKRIIIDPSFYYMVLGTYPNIVENQLIQEDWITAAKERHILFEKVGGAYKWQHSIRPEFGLDIAEFGSDRSVLCIRYGNFVESFEEFILKDMASLAEIIAERIVERKAKVITIDATGLGSGMSSVLRKELKLTHSTAIPIRRVVYNKKPVGDEEILSMYENIRAQMFFELRKSFESDKIMIPENKLLDEELKKPNYFKHIRTNKIDVTATPIMKAQLRRGLDRLNALALTYAVVEEYSNNEFGAFSYA